MVYCRWANCRWEFSEYQGRVRITTVDGQRRERLRRKLKRGQRGLLGVCCSGDGRGALQTPALRVKRRPRDGLQGNSFPKAMGQKLFDLWKS